MRGVVIALVSVIAVGDVHARMICPPAEQAAVHLPVHGPVADPSDTSPPAAPRAVEPYVQLTSTSAEPRHRVLAIAMNGAYSADTAVLDVTLTDAYGTLHYQSDANDLIWCSAPLELAMQPVAVTVIAIDRAGNASAPYHAIVQPQLAPVEHRPGIMTDDDRERVLHIVGVLAGMGIGFGIRALIRARRRRLPAEPVAPLVAEAVAKLVLRRYLVLTAVAAIACAVASTTSNEVATGVTGLAAFLGALHVIATRRLQNALEYASARSERRANYLIVTRHDPHRPHVVRASRYIYARASRAAMPTATVEER